ncbi:MAG: hypothetical protein PHC64_10485 [Candidatus Gastranaerophilales bacterium]|nr:hypothetical protein [Candidatus Gastranaerophilales bacterium]
MINPVVSNTVNKSVFSPLQSNGETYAITRPLTEEQKEKAKEQKSNNLGYNIARVALIAGFGVLVLMKGLPQNTRKSILEFLKSLEKRSGELAANNKHLSGIQRFYSDTLEFTKPLLQKTQTLFTLASFKDVLVKKASTYWTPLENLGNRITKAFERISIATSRRSYLRTLDRLEVTLARIDEIITSKNPAASTELRKALNGIRTKYIESFNEIERGQRLTNVKADMDEGGALHERFWNRIFNREVLKSSETYDTFLSEELLKGVKAKRMGDVKTKGDEIINGLNGIFEKYKCQLNDREQARLTKLVGRTKKSLEGSIDCETNRLFDKIRDLKMGSALNDSLSVLTSLGVVGWGLTKADNNDERISIGLKYGAPAILGVATSLLFTVGLVSTGPSLLAGLAIGFVTNKIFAAIDDARKKYKENKPIVVLPNIDLRSPIKNIDEIKNG